MAYRIMTIALGLAVMASPAAARTNTEQQKAKTTAPSAGEKKYCIAYDDVVGSRITRTECKTKAEWAKEGIDVDKPAKD